ncbi:MAG TPA: thiamine-phosphate kinase, partial [Candidatus Methylomirabilis sp.]
PEWLGVREEAALQAAIQSHLTPVPRLRAGQALVGCATAMIDVSDGVASDAGHLASESRVTVRILAPQVPIHPGALAMARWTSREPLDLALRGGEDYELLFTAAADPCPILAAAAPDLPVTRIGEVSTGPGVPVLLHSDGREETLAGGFDHFRSPV